jgi:hypothetical protein
MTSSQTSHLPRILEGLRSVQSIEDMRAYCVTVDELFLNEEIAMTDSDWPVFTQAVAVRAAMLSSNRSET